MMNTGENSPDNPFTVRALEAKVAQLEAEIALKADYIKRLEAENESLRLDRNLYDKGWDKVLAENEELQRNYEQMYQAGKQLEAENEALREAARWVFAGAINAENPNWGPCPHGIRPSYPTHAWWCDDCFEALRDALLTGEESE